MNTYKRQLGRAIKKMDVIPTDTSDTYSETLDAMNYYLGNILNGNIGDKDGHTESNYGIKTELTKREINTLGLIGEAIGRSIAMVFEDHFLKYKERGLYNFFLSKPIQQQDTDYMYIVRQLDYSQFPFKIDYPIDYGCDDAVKEVETRKESLLILHLREKGKSAKKIKEFLGVKTSGDLVICLYDDIEKEEIRPFNLAWTMVRDEVSSEIEIFPAAFLEEEMQEDEKLLSNSQRRFRENLEEYIRFFYKATTYTEVQQINASMFIPEFLTQPLTYCNKEGIGVNLWRQENSEEIIKNNLKKLMLNRQMSKHSYSIPKTFKLKRILEGGEDH